MHSISGDNFAIPDHSNKSKTLGDIINEMKICHKKGVNHITIYLLIDDGQYKERTITEKGINHITIYLLILWIYIQIPNYKPRHSMIQQVLKKGYDSMTLFFTLQSTY